MNLLSLVLIGLAFVGIIIALKLLIKRFWLLSWLRGTLGLSFLCVAVLMGLLAFEARSYKALLADQVIGVISFEKSALQQYIARLKLNDQPQTSTLTYIIAGDQWLIDAKIIRWHPSLARFGVKPAYALDRIRGRYRLLTHETTKPQTIYALGDQSVTMRLMSFDLWQAIDYLNVKSLVHSVYGSATYLPMVDGATYELALSSSGLVALPKNAIAKTAIERWDNL